MNVPPSHLPVTQLPVAAIRPAQQAAQESARPVVAAPQIDALKSDARRPGRASERSEADKEAVDTGSTDAQESLTPEQQRALAHLQARDREVRAHEAAHQAAAGPYARGSARYSYETGPDGKRYAVGGEVQIDTAKVANDPQATLDKARIIRRAALAPAEPSAQDQRVARQAAALEAQAQRELAAARSTPNAENLATDPTPVGTLLNVFA